MKDEHIYTPRPIMKPASLSTYCDARKAASDLQDVLRYSCRPHLPLFLCVEFCPALAQLRVHVCVVSFVLRVHHLIVVLMVPRIALSIGIADEGRIFFPLINLPSAQSSVLLSKFQTPRQQAVMSRGSRSATLQQSNGRS